MRLRVYKENLDRRIIKKSIATRSSLTRRNPPKTVRRSIETFFFFGSQWSQLDMNRGGEYKLFNWWTWKLPIISHVYFQLHSVIAYILMCAYNYLFSKYMGQKNQNSNWDKPRTIACFKYLLICTRNTRNTTYIFIV